MNVCWLFLNLVLSGLVACHLILHRIGLTAQMITVMTLVQSMQQICLRVASNAKCWNKMGSKHRNRGLHFVLCITCIVVTDALENNLLPEKVHKLHRTNRCSAQSNGRTRQERVGL